MCVAFHMCCFSTEIYLIHLNTRFQTSRRRRNGSRTNYSPFHLSMPDYSRKYCSCLVFQLLRKEGKLFLWCCSTFYIVPTSAACSSFFEQTDSAFLTVHPFMLSPSTDLISSATIFCYLSMGKAFIEFVPDWGPALIFGNQTCGAP